MARILGGALRAARALGIVELDFGALDRVAITIQRESGMEELVEAVKGTQFRIDEVLIHGAFHLKTKMGDGDLRQALKYLGEQSVRLEAALKRVKEE